MRKMILLLLMITFAVYVSGVTIYDIQYTTTPGPGYNYPSPLVGQVVSTQGIVTGTGFTGGKYAIAEDAGQFKSIFVNDPTHTPQLGDMVSVTGTVAEVSGLTEINTITSYNVVSSGNALPAVTSVPLSGLMYNTGEAYEGVLVKISNVRVSVAPMGSQFSVTDNVYNCIINDGFFPQPHTWSGILIGQIWAEINGIVSYSSGQYKVNPRNDNDMVALADINTISLKVEDVTGKKDANIAVNVLVSKLQESWGIKKYSFKVGFNKRILKFVDVYTNDTVTPATPDMILSADEDSITIAYNGTNSIVSEANNGVLIKLIFHSESYGESVLDITQGTFSDTVNASILIDGKVNVPIKKSLAWLSIYNNDVNGHFINQKNIFNPWLDEKITIEYGCKNPVGGSSNKAIVRIYDVQGRLVATPVNANMDATTINGIIGTPLKWNGRDRNGNILPIGVYYCHLEIINRTTGNSEVATQPIVIAAEMK